MSESRIMPTTGHPCGSGCNHLAYEDAISDLQRQLSAARAEAEQARDRAAEGWGYSNAWMRLHDQTFGWVQQRPAIFKEFCENDPRGDMPSPERVKAALAELREQARAEAIEERREDLKRAFVAGCCAVLTWTKSGMPQDDLDEAGYDYAATVALATTTPKGEKQ